MMDQSIECTQLYSRSDAQSYSSHQSRSRLRRMKANNHKKMNMYMMLTPNNSHGHYTAGFLRNHGKWRQLLEGTQVQLELGQPIIHPAMQVMLQKRIIFYATCGELLQKMGQMVMTMMNSEVILNKHKPHRLQKYQTNSLKIQTKRKALNYR